MKINEYWQFVLDKAAADLPVVLLIVTAHHGATPGKTGFKMAAAADGGLAGSIGGGKLEYDLVEEARRLLRMPRPAPVLRHLHLADDGSPAANGMICGGQVSILLYPLRVEDRPVIERILAAHSAAAAGAWSITQAGMVWREESGPSRDQQEGDPGAPAVLYPEQILPRDTLYILGGGHVSLALSQLMSLLEWRIVVLDDRAAVDTLERNRWADEKIVTPFAEVARHLQPGEKSWAVIMTPSHRADEEVLRQLVRLPLRYLGMMASRAKAAEILARLRAEGLEEALLQRVCTPVGLPIASHTPAEIAVSIAAQLIQIRNHTPVRSPL